MRKFSGKVRQKTHWWEKVFDASIASRWREEMVEQVRVLVDKFWDEEERFRAGKGEKKWPRDSVTAAQLDYIFDELRYDASQLAKGDGIYVSTALPFVVSAQPHVTGRRSRAHLFSSIAFDDSDGSRVGLSHPAGLEAEARRGCLKAGGCAGRREGLASWL